MEQSIYFQAYQDYKDILLVQYQGNVDSFYVNKILYPAKLLQENKNFKTYQIELPLDYETVYEVSDKFFNTTIMQRRYIVKDLDFDQYFYYDGDDLGPSFFQNYCQFKIWSPLASEGYLKYVINQKIYVEPLKKLEKGIFCCVVKKNLEHALYRYLFKINGEWVETVDPYSYSCNTNGQYSAIIDLTKTQIPLYEQQLTPLKGYTDAVIYELSVRDFSSHLPINYQLKGKYVAFCEKDLLTEQQHPIGLDYLSFLGITHVQLMPITDFATIDEIDNSKNYNWGYDPFLWNCFEGSYSTNPENPYCRIVEVKQMIQALHQKNIRVVLDLVFNHFYFTKENVLNRLVPNYFFQMDQNGNQSNGSFCGNDFDSSTKMGQKYIIDLVKRLVFEYKIDGIRLDLMGILDLKVINKLQMECQKINPQFILYGEGWNMPSHLKENQRASLLNAEQLPNVAFFNDYFRDIVKGKNFDRELHERGYINGNSSFVYEMMRAMKGSIDPYCYFKDAAQSINYIECHDNATLHDKLLVSNADYDDYTKNQILLCSLATIMFSLGIPFLHSGMEFHRTKQGKTNTYNEPDSINAIDWKLVDTYFENCLALKGFIRLRKKYRIFSIHDQEIINKHFHYEVLEHNILKIYYQNLEELDGIHELVFFINPTDNTSNYDFYQYFKFICSEHGLIRSDVYCSKIVINPFSFSMYIKEIE